MSIEAMKRALKTFEKIHEGCGFVKEDDLHKDAKDLATYVQEDCDFTMRTLRQAIEKAEKQEPVCDKDPHLCWSVRCQLGKVCKNTAPPRKEWIGLTEKEIFEADNAGQGLIEFARAIETKLKGRNT